MAEGALRADAERNRGLIIEAGIRVLAGNPEASIQEVVDESGVGRTTFYRHFSSRDGLLEEVTEEILVRARRRAAGATVVAGDPETSIRNLSKALLDVGFEWGRLITSRGGESDALRAARGAEDSPTLAFLEQGRARGDLRSDLPQGWMRAVIPAIVLVAIEQVDAGEITHADAHRYVAATLISVLLPPR